MNLRVSAQHAGWSIREAAWGFEERVLWRGSDATHEGLQRAGRALAPLQKLIQTKVTWPLADAYRARGRKTRAAIAASTATLALAAGAAGGIAAAQHSTTESAAPAPATAPVVAVAPHAAGNTLVLQGVTPRFKPGHRAVSPPAQPAKPTEPAAQVAWAFAEAFVGYEVGTSSKRTQQVFSETATRPLAKALAEDPPRLPAKGKVPQARVLNVVVGSATKRQVTASVSLVRLRAVSELRLTLSKTGDQWRVAQVLG